MDLAPTMYFAPSIVRTTTSSSSSKSISATPPTTTESIHSVKSKKSINFKLKLGRSKTSESSTPRAPPVPPPAWPSIYKQTPVAKPKTDRSVTAPAVEKTKASSLRTVSSSEEKNGRGRTSSNASGAQWPGWYTQQPEPTSKPKPRAPLPISSPSVTRNTPSSPTLPTFVPYVPPIPPRSTSNKNLRLSDVDKESPRIAISGSNWGRPTTPVSIDVSVTSPGPVTPKYRSSAGYDTSAAGSLAPLEVGRADLSSMGEEQGENWWDLTPRPPSLPCPSTPEYNYTYNSDICLDDSPTIPNITLPEPSIKSLSSKQIGKLPVRPPSSGAFFQDLNEKTSSMGLFSLYATEEVDAQRSYSKDQASSSHEPLYFDSPRSSISSNSFSNAPVIPIRTTSRSPSLRSITRDGASRSLPLKPNTRKRPNSLSLRQPLQPRTRSLPTPYRGNSRSTPVSIKRSSARTSTSLHSISELPRDLDASPNGSWALRSRPKRRSSIRYSVSQPNLRSCTDMNLKLRVSRSNSQSFNPGTFLPRDAWPSASEREKELRGRASFSGSTRPSSPNSDERSQSPKLSFLSIRKGNGSVNNSSRGRPSLLGLPESWSSAPKSKTKPKVTLGISRSTSDSAVPSFPDYTMPLSLSFPSIGMSRSNSSLSIDLPREVYTHEKDEWSELVEAIAEAETWSWPNPPSRPPYEYRNTKFTPEIHTNSLSFSLSTSETVESMSTFMSPQTPQSADFCLHGEVGYLAQAPGSKAKRRVGSDVWRRDLSPGSDSRSLDSLEISL